MEFNVIYLYLKLYTV